MQKYKNVLFDLDGTLFCVDTDLFVETYFKLLCKKLIPYGYDPKVLIDAIMKATYAMIKNDGKQTNEELFWNYFAKLLGPHVVEHKPVFEDFYANDFKGARHVAGFNQKLVDIVKKLQENSIKVGLATSPVFPEVATRQRIEWSGLKWEDFEFVTTYENVKFSKPSAQYYLDCLNRIGAKAEDTIMVGNDVEDDGLADKVGMRVFILTDYLINKKNLDLSKYPHGNADDLYKYLFE